jgi:spermidine synthase
MSSPQPQRSETTQAARYLPALLPLFAASGCAALIYEVTWYQSLQLVIGSTSVSLAFLLAAFMGGLCIGSVGYPRMRSDGRHPLRTYAYIEIGIAACAILELALLPLIQRLYWAGAVPGLFGMVLRGIISAICLMPPTILMGASLPAAARWIESTPRGASWWGILYGTNTAGAGFGCLLAGFYLLRLYDTIAATVAAVAINLAVAASSLLVASRAPAKPAKLDDEPTAPGKPAGSPWGVYITIAISGATALGAEVVWTRLLGYLLGVTVYCFSIILAVFLIGLAIGGTVGSWIARILRGPAAARLALGWSQILLTAAIFWTAFMLSKSLPYWPVNPILTTNPWFSFQLDLARTLWTILPSTLLWGASFPLALAAVASRGGDSGRMVGGVYAANTFGAIAGAIGVSLILVPSIGTQDTQRAMLLLAAAGGCVLLIPHLRRHRSIGLAGALSASLVLAFVLASDIDPVPGELMAFGRKIMTSMGNSKVLYTKEGINSTVVISQWNDGAMQIDVNGHVEATNEPYDMKLQRMVGHLPALLHPNPRRVLGIGFGAGVSAGTFTRYPSIESITICEIEPVIPPTSNRFFGREDYEVMNDPRTHIVFDDARHYLMTTNDRFDIIASDPLDVFAKGTAALYSKEYFEAVKKHLNPGGIFTLYVPLYETDMRTIKSELATFFDSFPHGTVWQNTINGEGYDTVFMGHLEAPKINLDELQERFNRPDYAPVAQSLMEIEFPTPFALLANYGGRKADFESWLAGSDINLDRNLRLQYIAGWGINSDLAREIHREMMHYRTPPVDLFTGSPELVRAVMARFGGR